MTRSRLIVPTGASRTAQSRGPARRALAALLALAFVLAAGAALASTSERPLMVEDLAGMSDDVVVGTVLGTETRWEGRMIVSVTRLAVGETLKGGREEQIEITQLGGTAVHPRTGIAMTMTASTQVEMRVGDEVVIFAARGRDGKRRPVGGAQGVLGVRTDARTGRKEVPIGPKQLVVEQGERHTLRTEVMSLDELRMKIRESLDRSGGER